MHVNNRGLFSAKNCNYFGLVKPQLRNKYVRTSITWIGWACLNCSVNTDHEWKTNYYIILRGKICSTYTIHKGIWESSFNLLVYFFLNIMLLPLWYCRHSSGFIEDIKYLSNLTIGRQPYRMQKNRNGRFPDNKSKGLLEPQLIYSVEWVYFLLQNVARI